MYRCLGVLRVPRMAQYLHHPSPTYRAIVAALRSGELRCLSAMQRRGGPGPWVPFAQRGPCPLCYAVEPEGGEHFLLRCGAWWGRRQQLWADIARNVGACVARVVAQAVAQGNDTLLLRVLLCGDLSEDMPAGFATAPARCRTRAAADAAAGRIQLEAQVEAYLCDVVGRRRGIARAAMAAANNA